MSFRSGSPLTQARGRHWSEHDSVSSRRADYGAAGSQAHYSPAAEQATNGSSFALVHAGRTVRIGPVVFWTIVGSIVTMAAWSAATATYFAFRDDVLTRLVARQ